MRKIFALSIAMLLLTATSKAADVTLTWDPSISENIDYYKVHFRAADAKYYTDSINVGNVVKYTMTGLEDDTEYCFVATAVDTAGHESIYSNEICMDDAPSAILAPVMKVAGTAGPVIMVMSAPQVGATTATIAWVTEKACGPASARYRAVGATVWQEIKSNNLPTTDHIVTLSGLKARTPYEYIVDAECDGTRIESGARSFNTK